MFILHTPKASKPTSIILKKALFDGPFKASLGVSLNPIYWDKETERAIVDGLDKATADENKSINILLQKVWDYIDARTRDARYTGNHLTGADLQVKLEQLTGRKRESKGTKFFAECRDIIEDMKSGKLLTPVQGKKYSAGTIKNYNQSLNCIETYDSKLTWAAVDMKFYRSFIKWCNDNDWSMNYIAQHIKNIIRLMKVGKSKSYKFHNNLEFLDEEFKVIQEETDDIALTQAEMDNISDKHLINREWDIARDWFVIGSYLGLRVSDVKVLDEDLNFTEDSVIIANEKTDTKVAVPINHRIRAIMKKWKGLPPRMTDVEINRHIKKVGEVCNINDKVLYFLTKGGKRKDFYLKKFEMLSCHTMRRFFITELIRLKTVPDNIIMQLAGIKKHSTLLRYKKIGPEETAQDMKGKAFFK